MIVLIAFGQTTQTISDMFLTSIYLHVFVAGFLLDHRSVFLNEQEESSIGESHAEYRHCHGYGFTCLRVFRDWCRVTPKKRPGWCQTRGFNCDVLESVCDFVVDVRGKLNSNQNNGKPMFRHDTKSAENTVISLFLEHFGDGLAVYSGSDQFGYTRLCDNCSLKLPRFVSSVAPSKFALFFKLESKRKAKCDQYRHCSLCVSEQLVMEHLKRRGTLATATETIDRLSDKAKVVAVRDICPLVLKKMLSATGSADEFTKKLRSGPLTWAHRLAVTVNCSDNSLCVHMLKNGISEEMVRAEIERVIQEEKQRILDSVAHFEFPKNGSGVTLEVMNNGKVKDVRPSEGDASKNANTLLIYVCCEAPVSQDIHSCYEGEGKLVRLMSESDEKIACKGPRLWGKLHCRSQEDRNRLFPNYPRGYRDTWSSPVFLAPARPDLRADSSSVDFVRLTLREIAAPVSEVVIHTNSQQIPKEKYIIVGKDPCKLWSCPDGKLAFVPNQKFVTNQKIIRAAKETFGAGVRVSIERNTNRHKCFQRERRITASFRNVLTKDANYYLTTNPPDVDSGCNSYYLDLFSGGKEFLKAYQKAKKTKSLSRDADSFWVHRVEYCSAMMVEPEVYDCVWEGVDIVSANRLGVAVETSRTSAGMIVIKAQGMSEGNVSRVVRVLKKVISPEVIVADDVDPESNYLQQYLASAQGKLVLDQLEAETGVKFLRKTPGDAVLIYGPPESRKDARKKILLEKPVAVALPENTPKLSLMKYLAKTYGKDFGELCRESGADSLFWNAKMGHFAVWGSPSAVEMCRSKLQEASQKVLASSHDSSDMCVACFCPTEGFPFKLSLCGHLYCESCINLHVTVAVRDRTLPIHCAAEGCGEPILLGDIGRTCNYSTEGRRLFLDATLSLFMAQQGDSCPVRRCPTPDCPAVYFISEKQFEGKETVCNFCHTSICNNCQVSPYHFGYTCALWKCKDKVDEATALWFAADEVFRKLCSRCGMGIEKVDGCDNVYCENCKASICFKCMQYFEDNNQCYAHLDGVHGGPY